MANGGLVTDPELFPSWANDGDNIYQWTDSKNVVFLVPTTVYNLLTQPWRGQANCNRNVKNAAKSVLKLCKAGIIIFYKKSAICKDQPFLDYKPEFEQRAPTPEDVKTRVLLLSTKTQISIYSQNRLNITKLTSSLLKHKEVSDEVSYQSYHGLVPRYSRCIYFLCRIRKNTKSANMQME